MVSLDAAFASAEALLDDHDFERAKVALTDVLDASSGRDRALAHALRGFASYRQKLFADAETDFTAAIRLQPDAVNTFFLRAKCREELDDLSGALSDYEAITSLEPDTADAWEGAMWIYRYLGREAEANHAALMAETARTFR
jgi:tetratricopeptide (TPR) repeat protein